MPPSDNFLTAASDEYGDDGVSSFHLIRLQEAVGPSNGSLHCMLRDQPRKSHEDSRFEHTSCADTLGNYPVVREHSRLLVS